MFDTLRVSIVFQTLNKSLEANRSNFHNNNTAAMPCAQTEHETWSDKRKENFYVKYVCVSVCLCVCLFGLWLWMPWNRNFIFGMV